MSQSNFVWVNTGPTFMQRPGGTKVFEGSLPKGIYRPDCNQNIGWFLEKIGDDFDFPFKPYGISQPFIDHVLYKWNNSPNKANLGILLNGIKGTGKTVTGKIIANALNLPIIMIDRNMEGLIHYVSGFDFSCVVFFDEYEKNFKDGHDVLTLMDGMLSGISRKFFILTTNTKYINDNMLSRPSRILYKKEFRNLELESVKAIVDDLLVDKSVRDEVIRFINTLEVSTVDIVKALIEEANMFGWNPKNILSYLNIEQASISYKTYYCYGEYCQNDITKFIERCSKVGSPGKSERYDTHKESLTPYDLYLESRSYISSIPANSLKVGDEFNGETITRKDGDYITTFDEGDIRFYKILNPDQQRSLYDNLTYIL